MITFQNAYIVRKKTVKELIKIIGLVIVALPDPKLTFYQMNSP